MALAQSFVVERNPAYDGVFFSEECGGFKQFREDKLWMNNSGYSTVVKTLV